MTSSQCLRVGWGIFRTLCNTCISRKLVYSECCNIQNPSIIASRRIFRTLLYLQKQLNPCVTLKIQDPGIFTKIVKPLCYLENSEPWHIVNPRIFRTLTYLNPDTYLEPSQRFKMECLGKQLKTIIIFPKPFILDL